MKYVRKILILVLTVALDAIPAQAQYADTINNEILSDPLSEDTTFFYEGEDTTEFSIYDQDFDDISDQWGSDESFISVVKSLSSDSGWGIFAIFLMLFLALLFLILIFAFLTAPIWIIALILWLLFRKNRKKNNVTTNNTTTVGNEEMTQQHTDNYNKSEN